MSPDMADQIATLLVVIVLGAFGLAFISILIALSLMGFHLVRCLLTLRTRHDHLDADPQRRRL